MDITVGDDFLGLYDWKKVKSLWVLFSMVMDWWVLFNCFKCRPVDRMS